MPARKSVLEQQLVRAALLPLANALNSDPASQRNRKRWSVPMYQILRLLSVLSIPISQHNEILKPGCSLDLDLLKLRTDFALNRPAMAAFVALLQYYIERKAEKQASLATAEDSKLEDARIDNIMRFFKNVLSPPRAKVGPDIMSRDRGVHLALVAALVEADFYSSLIVLFSTKEDAAAQYSDLVFLVADVYAQTLRHTTPQQIYRTFRESRKGDRLIKVENSDVQKTSPGQRASVFDETPEETPSELPPVRQAATPSHNSSRSSGLRAAIQRERTFIGGSRAITKSARWTSLHSGGFTSVVRQSTAAGALDENQSGEPPTMAAQNDRKLSLLNVSADNLSRKRVVSTRNAIQSKLSLNPDLSLKDKMKVNSDLLCLQVTKGRTKVMNKESLKTTANDTMRRDLQRDGLRGIVRLITELTNECFDHFLLELRSRIEEMKTKPLGQEAEALMKAQRAFLTILGSVVGFHRERYGRSCKPEKVGSSISCAAHIHQNSMKMLLAADFKIVRKEWVSVESAINVETFRLVFRILVEACDSVKGALKQDMQPEDVERATFAIAEMMKILQGMAAVDDESTGINVKDGEQIIADIRNNNNDLTTREIALNTIEELFQEEAFLNAPADLAKDYTAKNYSFRHLTNIVEVIHAFTTILLDEKELAHLQVSKKKRSRKAQKARNPKHEINREKPIPKDEALVTKRELRKAEGKGLHTKNEDTEALIEEKPHQGCKEKDSTMMESNELSNYNVHPQPESNQASNGRESLEDDKDNAGSNQKNEERKIMDSRLPDTEKLDEGEEPDYNEDADSSDDEDILELQIREIESVGIIRRFANSRALQSLLLPIRVAICKASSLTGSLYNIPDGAEPLSSPVVTAKSVHALASIWKVAESQERGALCGQFFTFSTMHLLNSVLDASRKESVVEGSVLACFAAFARDATSTFLSWLSLNPGLALDMFFPMDKQSCNTYMTTRKQRQLLRDEQDRKEDSGNDSDISALVIENDNEESNEDSDDNVEFEIGEQRAAERRERKTRQKKMQLRRNVVERHREKRTIEEDEDVDDLDNLDIGLRESSPDASGDADENAELSQGKKQPGAEVKSRKDAKRFCRLPASRKRKQSKSAEVTSDKDGTKGKAPKRQQKIRRKKSSKEGESKRDRKSRKQKKEFESSDENSEDVKLLESFKSDSDGASEDFHRGNKERWNIRQSRSSIEKDIIPSEEHVGQKTRSGLRRSEGECSSDFSSAGKFTDEESDEALDKVLQLATTTGKVGNVGTEGRKQLSRKKRRTTNGDVNQSPDEAPTGDKGVTTPKTMERREATEPGTLVRSSPVDRSKSEEQMAVESEDAAPTSGKRLFEGKRKRIVALSSEDSE